MVQAILPVRSDTLSSSPTVRGAVAGTSGVWKLLASRTAITRQLRKAILKHGKMSILLKLDGGNLGLIRSSTPGKGSASGRQVDGESDASHPEISGHRRSFDY